MHVITNPCAINGRSNSSLGANFIFKKLCPHSRPVACLQHLCRELVCITAKWTWYNGRDILFHITSGRIDMCKGVNQLKELFFLNLIIIFWIYVWNWQIIGIIWLKTHYFSQFITKMGFCCKILSLNDLTRVRSVDRDPLFTMTTSQRACKPVMTTRAFSRRNQHRAKALCWKSGGRKKVLVMLGYHSIQLMLSI